MDTRLGTTIISFILSANHLLAQEQNVNIREANRPKPSSWQLSGDLFLDFGLLSKKPAFIRGQLPYQLWLAGWQVKVDYLKRLQLNLLTTIAGGTPFDNPERFDYSIGTQFNVNKNIGIFWGIDASYNVNQGPIIDPAGRIPNTGLSEMFAGLKLTTQRNGYRQIKNEVYFTKNIRGNMPVINNNFTGPYVGWRGGNNFLVTSKLDDRYWALTFDAYLEGENRKLLGGPAAIGATTKLEYYIGKHFVWQVGATARHNITATGIYSTKQAPFSQFIGIAPIGSSIFIVWTGPHFIF